MRNPLSHAARIAIIAVGAAALFQCTATLSRPCDTKELVDRFLRPTYHDDRTLARCRCDSAAWYAAIDSLRRASPVGDVRLRLTDSVGALFSLGYRTPANVRQDTLYPLIIYLHGGVGTERNDKGDSAFLMLEALADTFSLFLASPSANRYAPWWGPQGLSRILQTLRYMALHYPINPDKVFLAGVSDGATGCYAAANTIGGPFAGFFAISGFGGMLPRQGMPLVPTNLMQRPIYNINAGRDRLYPIDLVTGFLAELRQQGVPVIKKVYPDEEHGFDYRMREMATLAAYLRNWSRPHADAIVWNFVPGFPALPGWLVDWRITGTEPAFIRAFWRHDTLVVRSRGIAAFSIEHSRGKGAARAVCTVAAEKKRCRTMTAHRVSGNDQVRVMRVRCFPLCTPAELYTIQP